MFLDKREIKFGFFLLAVASFLITIIYALEFWVLYDGIVIARLDDSKISYFSNWAIGIMIFLIIPSLTCYIAGLKRILPKDKKVYWGIGIFTMAMLFLMVALAFAVLTFFNVDHGRIVIQTTLTTIALFFFISVSLFFLGFYVIYFLRNKK